jgi:hypothetical protein
VYRYTAFGLEIRSAFFFPELLAGKKNGRPDVTIREDRARAGRLPPIPQDDAIVSPREACLAFSGLGTCVVRDGREIIVTRFATSHDGDLRLALLGPAIAVLLQQRGFLVLHASVVNIAGRAVAFLGSSGEGKSTMAAALNQRGHELVVDDLAAVRVENGRALVFPGFPQYKLWPDAAIALGRDVEALPRLHPDFEKRACRLDHGFSSRLSLPLARIFELSMGSSVCITPVGARDAVLALLRNSYGIEWLHSVSGAAQLQQRAEVARGTRVATLERPNDLAVLPAIVDTIEADVASAA